jgi:hypothetical protein
MERIDDHQFQQGENLNKQHKVMCKVARLKLYTEMLGFVDS